MSWCATTACTRGTWPSCSPSSEHREEEEEEEEMEKEGEEEVDDMSCRFAEKDGAAWSTVTVPCQTARSGERCTADASHQPLVERL